jgi:hypothetical protein
MRCLVFDVHVAVGSVARLLALVAVSSVVAFERICSG